jgi:hypothetical protein
MEKYKIRISGRYHINDVDGTLDVKGNVEIAHNYKLRKLPLKFNKVSGDFICYHNALTSLKGCPTNVGGDFNCYDNQLTSLKHSPKYVGRHYICHENLLTTLKGCPEVINGNFIIANNLLTNLKGCPNTVTGNLYLQCNKLTSLENSTRSVGGNLNVTDNPLFNLVGCPDVGNTLFFENTVRFDMGCRKCIVKSIMIQRNKKMLDPEYKLPEAVIVNQKHLPIIIKYMEYLEFYPSGKFDFDLFSDMILEIREGFL